MTQPPEPPTGERHPSGSPWLGVLTGLLGVVMFVIMDVLLVLNAVNMSGVPRTRMVIIGTVILLLIALAGVLLMVRGRSYAVKGLGIGLMIGWSLATIVSIGYCTGINPGVYSARPR